MCTTTVSITRKHAIPWDMGSAGKTRINYAGILLWNANYNSKTWASSHKPHGRASVKRKKFLNPVQQHKAGFDRGKRTSLVCAWQGKIWWVPAESTRAATSHTVISRALKLYLVSSLKSIHVTALQIFTSGRYSSMQLVSLSLLPHAHPNSHAFTQYIPLGIGHYLFAYGRGRRILVVWR